MTAEVTPIREWILKLHERCNIACDHCYMYEAADQGWRTRPMAMAASTVSRVALRLAEHAEAHQLSAVRVVLHGGEPLLAGLAGVAHALEEFRTAVPPFTTVSFAVQTNGILLSDAFLELFLQHGVSVGVSLDGDREANDRHRRYTSGRSSYDKAVAGINRLRQPRFRQIYGGLLCTVDVRNDPVGTYLSLLEHQPPAIDFLLPHGNWRYPPPFVDPDGTDTPYADWLIPVFDHWYGAPRKATAIRLFDSILSLLLGGPTHTEAIGPDQPAMVAVESDGSLEGSDALKVTAPDGAATGYTVFSHSFDDLTRHPAVVATRQGLAGLSDQCQQCPVVAVCGGGLYAHRYGVDGSFDHPSVFCRDLFKLVTHVSTRVREDIAALQPHRRLAHA